MISKLLSQVLKGQPERLTDDDARVALTALLVRAARADQFYDDREARQIDQILQVRFDLSPFEAAALRAEGEKAETEAADTVQFTRAIKEVIPLEERISVIAALWQVVLVDQERDPEEDSLLRLVSNLLGINDRDSAIARQSVQQR